MSATVHKFDLPFGGEGAFELYLPADAEPLCVQLQFDRPCLWARVDTNAPYVPHAFAMIGTGNPCPSTGRYVGTFQQFGGSLIWHVFHGGPR